jgi:hypothetical protein
MDLSDAFLIIRQYRDRFGPVFLQTDHICNVETPHTRPCSLPDSAIYTLFDAMLDTSQTLTDRVTKGGVLKP